MGFRVRTIDIVKILIVVIILAVLTYLVAFLSDLFLPKYKVYISDASTAVIVGLGGYVIVKILLDVISPYLFSRMDKGVAHTARLAISVALYTIVVLAVLSALGINLTGVALGGTVAGIAIGLAAQTVFSNVLAGFMVSSSKTLKPGDSVILSSWIWGNPIVGEVTNVSLLFTEVRTLNGNLIKVPNSAFLGNTTFTKLSDGNQFLEYPLQVTINADVKAEQVLSLAQSYIKDSFDKEKLQVPEMYFTAKNGSTNTFMVILKFSNIVDLNTMLTLVNTAFEKAYWDAKTAKT
jgi:small-conductance mechanosensitive channel